MAMHASYDNMGNIKTDQMHSGRQEKRANAILFLHTVIHIKLGRLL